MSTTFSSKLRIRGAIPSGCNVARSAFAGGSSSAGAIPRAAARSRHSRARGSSAGRARAPGRARAHPGSARAPRGRAHLVAVERALAVRRREAGRQQESIALSERDLESLGEVEHHLPARTGSPCLDEAQVPRRDGGSQRQLELAQIATRPPLAQQLPGVRRSCGDSHDANLPPPPWRIDYLTGHCRASPHGQLLRTHRSKGAEHVRHRHSRGPLDRRRSRRPPQPLAPPRCADVGSVGTVAAAGATALDGVLGSVDGIPRRARNLPARVRGRTAGAGPRGRTHARRLGRDRRQRALGGRERRHRPRRLADAHDCRHGGRTRSGRGRRSDRRDPAGRTRRRR